MLFAGTDRIIEPILEDHLETLQFLWERRFQLYRSPQISWASFMELEEQIVAHTDAFVLAGDDAMSFLLPGLTADETSVTLASAFALLCMERGQGGESVTDAFKEASGAGLDGLRQALCWGQMQPGSREVLRQLMLTADPDHAASAAEILVHHDDVTIPAATILDLLHTDSAPARRVAWRIVANAYGKGRQFACTDLLSRTFFERGLADCEPTVYRQVLETALWTRQEWLLDYCRKVAPRLTPEVMAPLEVLALLGDASDKELMLAACRASALGLDRYELLSNFGHPALLPLLVEDISSGDPALSVAAAKAYSTITGADLDAAAKAKLVPEGEGLDEFDAEFAEVATLPNVAKALVHSEQTREAFSRGTRWRRGAEVNTGVPPALPEGLDNEARWGICLRAHYHGAINWIPAAARFPMA